MCLPPRDEGEVSYEVSASKKTRREEDDDEGPRVTFQECDSQVHEIPTALSCLGEDQDRRQLWYIRDDIQGFRRQAEKISEKLRNGVQEDNEARGLELRVSFQRRDRKHLVVKRILDAQDDDCTSEELASISQEHSVWSRKLALAQAHKDYYSAYHPNLTSVLPEMPALLDCCKDSVTKKRSLLGSSLTQTGRRVRCRMF